MIDFQKLIVDDIEKNRNRRPPRDDSVYASELGYCKRRTYYAHTDPREHPPETLMLFEVGDIIHKKFDELLKASTAELGIAEIIPEGYICLYLPEDDLRITGYFDNLLIFNDGRRHLIEKKSASRIDNLDSPFNHHLLQTTVYQKATGADTAEIVYCNKNDMQVKSFDIDFNPEIFDEAIYRAKDVHYAMRNGAPPEPEGRLTPSRRWECKYCLWPDNCERDGGYNGR